MKSNALQLVSRPRIVPFQVLKYRNPYHYSLPKLTYHIIIGYLTNNAMSTGPMSPTSDLE